MAFKTKCVFSEEVHEWGHYIPAGATKLLIGTFPTKINERKFDFFYSSRRNRFWSVMSAVLRTTLVHERGIEAVAERKRVLDKLKLGLTDIGYRVYRQKESSLDHHLFPVEFNDIFGLLENYPLIDTLIITSSSGGNSVLSWFGGYCDLNEISLMILDQPIPWTTGLSIAGKKVKVIVCYSTSSTLRKISLAELTDHYRQVIWG